MRHSEVAVAPPLPPARQGRPREAGAAQEGDRAAADQGSSSQCPPHWRDSGVRQATLLGASRTAPNHPSDALHPVGRVAPDPVGAPQAGHDLAPQIASRFLGLGWRPDASSYPVLPVGAAIPHRSRGSSQQLLPSPVVGERPGHGPGSSMPASCSPYRGHDPLAHHGPLVGACVCPNRARASRRRCWAEAAVPGP